MITNEKTRQRIITVLSEVLDRLCERNDHFLSENKGHTEEENLVTRFHALRPPSINIKYYLQRIAKYSNCSEECFVLALIFIDRLIRANENFLVTSLNVHRLVITAVMIAAKFFDDQYFNNAYYGKVGGVTCREMNLLEIEFLFMINFNLFVETADFEIYSERLLNHRVHDSGNKVQQTAAVRTGARAQAAQATAAAVAGGAAPTKAPTAAPPKNTAAPAKPKPCKPAGGSDFPTAANQFAKQEIPSPSKKEKKVKGVSGIGRGLQNADPNVLRRVDGNVSGGPLPSTWNRHPKAYAASSESAAPRSRPIPVNTDRKQIQRDSSRNRPQPMHKPLGRQPISRFPQLLNNSPTGSTYSNGSLRSESGESRCRLVERNHPTLLSGSPSSLVMAGSS